MTRRRAPGLVLALVVLTVGCGDDGGAAPVAQSSTSAPPTTAPPTTAPTASTDAPTTTPVEPAEPLLPGLDPSIREIEIKTDITLADGAAMPAVFDGYEAGPVDGELVLLLHGFPQSAYEWRAQLAALGAEGYRAVAVTQRGYSAGARPTADADYATVLLADDVAAFGAALGAETFHVVGHDWGGSVAWLVAARHPDRVDTLAVLSTPHPGAYAAALANPDGEQSQKAGYIATFVDPASPALFTADGGEAFLRAASGSATDDDIAAYVDVLGTEAAMSAALAWYRAAAGDTTSIGFGETDAAITVPTLFVWSDGDCCLGRDAAEATADFVDGPYRFEILEGVSHWVAEEAAAEVNSLLIEHLAG